MTYTIHQVFNSLKNLNITEGWIAIDANFNCITEDDIIKASQDTKEERLLGADPYKLIENLRETSDWFLVRDKRDKLLISTDWSMSRDVPEKLKIKYEKYRQELRDITKQNDPKNIVWPTKPS